jgi:hypothetical protein
MQEPTASMVTGETKKGAQQSGKVFADDGSNELELARPDPAALRGALIKLDIFFLPMLTSLYFLNFLDR